MTRSVNNPNVSVSYVQLGLVWDEGGKSYEIVILSRLKLLNYNLCLLLAFRFFSLFWLTLALFFQQVQSDVKTVLKTCTIKNVDTKQLEESISQMSSMPEAARLSSLLHLTCLLFEVSCFALLLQMG